MNEKRSFERFVADKVAGTSQGIPLPDDFYDDIHSFATTTRQRPEWLALIKEPPMRTNNHLAVGSPTARVMAIIVATLLLAVTLAGAGIAGQRLLAAEDDGADIVVAQDGGGDFATINEAIAAANHGDTILIMPGDYAEAVMISKDIWLRGEDRDSVVLVVGDGCLVEDSSSNGVTCPAGTPMYDGYFNGAGPYGILVDNAAAHVSDLTVRTTGEQQSWRNEALPWAFTAVGGAPTFEHVLAVHSGDGGSVYVDDGSAAAFLDSDFRSAVFAEEQSPMTLARSVVRGVVMVNASADSEGGSAEARIHDNDLRTLAFGGPVDVARNTFKFSGNPFLGTGNAFTQIGNDSYAVLVEDGHGWSISENEIDGGYIGGIHHSSGSGPGGNIAGNIVIGSDVGIRATIGTEHRVASNRVEGGGVGIQVGGAGLVEDNDVSGAKNVGIVISGNETLTLTGNTSCDNGLDLRVGTNATPLIDASNTFCEVG